MERRYAEYQPASRGRGLRTQVRLFRSVSLNLSGWAAIVLLCLAGAGIGYGGSRLIGLPAALGAAGGVLAVLAGLLVLDRRRWVRLRDHGAPNR
jgi:hypothetical protein